MSEDIIQILVRIHPGFDVAALMATAGGREWYVPTGKKMSQAQVREAIRRDPCRDYRVVARRYSVSIQTVYNVWNEKVG